MVRIYATAAADIKVGYQEIQVDNFRNLDDVFPNFDMIQAVLNPISPKIKFPLNLKETEDIPPCQS